MPARERVIRTEDALSGARKTYRAVYPSAGSNAIVSRILSAWPAHGPINDTSARSENDELHAADRHGAKADSTVPAWSLWIHIGRGAAGLARDVAAHDCAHGPISALGCEHERAQALGDLTLTRR